MVTVLSTGNKSELAVGYYLYGDMCGGLAVLSDLPKTEVYRIARAINANETVILITIDKPPSAELGPDKPMTKACQLRHPRPNP